MKKILYLVLTVFIMSSCVFADDKFDVIEVFESYIYDANSYSSSLANYYTHNAKIIRVVNKKQGGQKAILIPFDRYIKELNSHALLAKTVGYKNRYEQRKVTKVNNDYKVSAIRVPRNDKTGLPCYFIFTKTSSGWKIREESMTTNVQAFLNAR